MAARVSDSEFAAKMDKLMVDVVGDESFKRVVRASVYLRVHPGADNSIATLTLNLCQERMNDVDFRRATDLAESMFKEHFARDVNRYRRNEKHGGGNGKDQRDRRRARAC